MIVSGEGAPGATATDAVTPKLAVTVTVVRALTEPAVTWALPVVCPAGMPTLAFGKTVVFEDVRPMVAPAAGAGALRPTCTVAIAPLATEPGLIVIELIVGDDCPTVREMGVLLWDSDPLAPVIVT
jgi:hypothetical protein